MLAENPGFDLVALDALTYSGSLTTLETVLDHPHLAFVHGDIRDRDLVREVFAEHRPTGVIHLAAESHVDRSIVDPLAFVETNVVGTVVLLQEASRAWSGAGGRFHHVSTDEVFGELGATGKFDESTPYAPKSPYSASKAASDHFVRAWGSSYGLDYVITNCTNNYGPYQFPEKLIPVAILRALAGESVPMYGKGENIRDWLYVEDHCRALALVYREGKSGVTYGIGGESEVTNLELVRTILEILDDERGVSTGTSAGLIEFVDDRPGHDYRYAMDISRIRTDLGWSPTTTLEDGLRATVRWYLDNLDWLKAVDSEEHRSFQEGWYGGRRVNGED
jgi:dTDP-glucose 4,6-dehydratase